MPPTRSYPRLAWLLAFAAGTLLLCLAAFLNGGPLMFADSGTYIGDGDRLLHLKTPLAVRPIFYGVAIWPLHWNWSLWPVVLAQALVVTHLVWLTLRAFGTGLSPWAFVGVMAALAVLTPLPWYVAHILPDVFAGVVILGLVLLGLCADRLGRIETAYLLALVTAAISFHLSHLAIALAIAVLLVVARLTWRGGPVRPVLAAVPLALALLVSVLFSLAVFQRLALVPHNQPFLMARLIADGPGRDFLRAACPTHEYQLCKYVDEVPAKEEGVIWGWLPTIPSEEGGRIRAEAGQIVWGTIRMFPGRVARDALANTARQLVSIRSVDGFPPERWDQLQRADTMLRRDAGHSVQSTGALRDGERLREVNLLHQAVAVAGLVLCLALVWPAIGAGLLRETWLIVLVLASQLVNAFVSGALSGVFDRYQGRIVWLVPFTALACGLSLLRRRAGAPRGVRPALPSSPSR
ncbi:MAG TPA: hypothetical protein VE650_10030 [Acetobacteraceae bacterium]|nr:hypothetical protein [Acetobacteraceae bacterium]